MKQRYQDLFTKELRVCSKAKASLHVRDKTKKSKCMLCKKTRHKGRVLAKCKHCYCSCSFHYSWVQINDKCSARQICIRWQKSNRPLIRYRIICCKEHERKCLLIWGKQLLWFKNKKKTILLHEYGSPLKSNFEKNIDYSRFSGHGNSIHNTPPLLWKKFNSCVCLLWLKFQLPLSKDGWVLLSVPLTDPSFEYAFKEKREKRQRQREY